MEPFVFGALGAGLGGFVVWLLGIPARRRDARDKDGMRRLMVEMIPDTPPVGVQWSIKALGGGIYRATNTGDTTAHRVAVTGHRSLARIEAVRPEALKQVAAGASIDIRAERDEKTYVATVHVQWLEHGKEQPGMFARNLDEVDSRAGSADDVLRERPQRSQESQTA